MAMRCRYEHRAYQHGISYGGLGNINGGLDELLVDTSNNKDGKVYFFNTNNPKMVANFGIGTTPTPGAVNNAENQTYIDSQCTSPTIMTAANSRNSNQNSELSARFYPNPFSNLINIEVQSPEEREVQIQLHDFPGRLIYEQTEGLIKGLNELAIDLNQYVSDGIYFMSIRAEKEVLHEQKVVCVRQ